MERRSIEATRLEWVWWSTYHKKFTSYLLWFVLKLLFITNAALEREFSQVKHVIEAIGESGIQATLKVRLMERTLTSYGALTSPTLASYRTIIC
jgi:hypothetical protein